MYTHARIPAVIAAVVAAQTLIALEPHAAPAADPSVNKARLERVYIVYKTHFDIGYTSTAHDVVHEYRTEMTDRLIEAIEKNKDQPKERQFVWTLSGFPMQQILWEGQSPERRARIEQAIRDGNIAIHALPYTIHTETAEAEDLVRGLGISSTLARTYGRPLSISGKSTDVPGQSWILPTLMAHAGIRFFHMGGPVVNFAFSLPPVFWWEGPDGSRVLTFYNDDYGIPALPPADWPYKTWVHLAMTGDNQGPPSPDAVGEDLEFYRKRGIVAQVGTLDDFFNEFAKEALHALPVIRADLPCPWIHGIASMPAATRIAQRSRPLIGALDALATLERCWGVYRPDLTNVIKTAYWRTNFAAWIGDGARMTSQVRIWSFAKFDAESALYTPAMEMRVPAVAARSVARPGTLPPSQSGITLSRRGVAVSAFGPNPDGAGTIFRVWEQGGAGGELTVTLPAGGKFTTATPVTLRGETTGAPLEIAAGAFSFPLAAYAPASFVLK